MINKLVLFNNPLSDVGGRLLIRSSFNQEVGVQNNQEVGVQNVQ